MKTKTKEAPPQAEPKCLCQGAGPLLSTLIRQLRPPEEAQRHFQTARLEVLKGLRALINQRIERVSKTSSKGQNIQVD
jgi:hypothetical protein